MAKASSVPSAAWARGSGPQAEPLSEGGAPGSARRPLLTCASLPQGSAKEGSHRTWEATTPAISARSGSM